MKKFNFIINISILIVLIIIHTNDVQAQNKLSLKDALAITLKENIDIKIKTHELKQAEKQKKIGLLGLLPKVKINGSISANQGESSLEFATPEFPKIENATSESKSINGNIEFSYSLFNGLGSIYTYQKIKNQSDLKSIELSIEIEQILLKTAKQFFDIAFLQEKTTIITDLLLVSKERYNKIKVQNTFGNASKLDLLSAEIDLNKDSIDLMHAKFELDVAKNKFNQTLNNSLNSNFYVENKIRINKNLLFSNLKEETKENNNNILFHQYLIEITKNDKKINSSYILPNVNLSLQYGYNNTESNTSLILNQENLGLTGFINLSWDVFGAIANRKVTQNTRIELESNKLKLTSIKQKIDQEFNTIFKQYQNNINLIDIETRNQLTSEKLFEKAKEEYYQGTLSKNDFRLAQIDVSLSKNRLNKTIYNTKILELDLYRLAGKILEDTL
ncbi:MAG: hypothetical protein CMD06_01960 [Flavobacteriales bacterium]|nr:hypothetical protein [Flavobacteriales bacterium]|tara:strand:- start:6341 stop:7678 length:1338 start_codon:yes stop_codon:yes gene_type:complete